MSMPVLRHTTPSLYHVRMSFVAILVALLMEQARPLARANPIHGLLRIWVRWAGHSFDAGKPQHAMLAWGVAVLVPSLLAVLVFWTLELAIGWPAAVFWNILVLYVTLGFRQFSHHFTGKPWKRGTRSRRGSCWPSGSRLMQVASIAVKSFGRWSSIR